MSHISEVAVCNIALSRFGEDYITSLDDTGNVAAGLCQLNLPFARRKTLRRMPWGFALAHGVVLAPVEAPEIEWEYAFALPEDLVRVLDPLNQQGNKADRFVRVGQRLLTDWNFIALNYIRDVPDLTEWDDLAIDVLSLELSVRLAVPLTGDTQKRIALLQELEDFLINEARYIDSVESGSNENNPLADQLDRSYLNRSRRGAIHRRLRKGFDNTPDSLDDPVDPATPVSYAAMGGSITPVGAIGLRAMQIVEGKQYATPEGVFPSLSFQQIGLAPWSAAYKESESDPYSVWYAAIGGTANQPPWEAAWSPPSQEPDNATGIPVVTQTTGP